MPLQLLLLPHGHVRNVLPALLIIALRRYSTFSTREESCCACSPSGACNILANVPGHALINS